jgi:hypothetical protein
MSIKQNGGVFGRNPTFNDVTIEGVVVDGLTVDGEINVNTTINNGIAIVSTHDGSQISFESAVSSVPWSVGISGNATEDFIVYQSVSGSGAIKLFTNGGTRLNIANNGDVSLYDSAGTTAKFFWDASAESLSLSGTGGLNVTGEITADGLVHTGDTDTYIKFLANRIYSDVGGSRLLDLQSASSALSSTGSVQFNTGASLLEAMRIDSSQTVLVGTTTAGSAGAGDIVVSGGVYLGGTGAANLLDDYEEGTWTPVLSDGTNTATHSVQNGNYTKVGNLVTLTGRLITTSLTGTGTVAGAVRITGLPFNASPTSAYGSIYSAYYAGMALGTAGFQVCGRIEKNSSYASLKITSSTASTPGLDASEWSATGDLIFSITYYV